MKAKKTTLGIFASSLLVVSACGGGTSPSNPDSSPSAEPPEVSENFNVEGFPIVNEPITIKFMTGKHPTTHSDYNQVAGWKKYEEMTNIKIDWGLVLNTSLNEQRNLSLASGDYPDVYYTAKVPVTDIAKYSQQGVFIQLDELIEEYMPNLNKLFEEYPDVRKGLTMPDGHIYSLPTIYSFDAVQIGGMAWIRQDWLEQLNMDMPETLDDFYEYLTAVKNTDLNGNGQADEIPFGAGSIGGIIDFVKGSYGLGNRGYHHKFVDQEPGSDELRFFPITDQFRDMVEYLHKLYSEGLIQQNIYSMETNQYLATGSNGLYGSTTSKSPEVQFGSKDYIAVPALKGPDGEQMFANKGTPLSRIDGFLITDRNPDPAASLRWMDYFYSDEGAKQFFMGIEGESYEQKEDGSYDYLEKFRNDPNGLTLEQAIAPYVTYMGGGYPGIVKQEFFKGAETSEKYLAGAEMYAPFFPEEVWAKFTYTAEESQRMAALADDIEKYVEETRDKFIVGEISLDQWDQYVDQVQKMGLDRYMEIYQAAYERYSAN